MLEFRFGQKLDSANFTFYAFQMDKEFQDYEKTRWIKGSKTFCHAPYISLNFDQEGNIRACCYNVLHPLGKFPQDSIQEALKSPAAVSLRSAIDERDLSKGCYNCKSQLQAQNYYSVHARHYDYSALSLPVEAVPRVLEFELSNICNLECTMCNGFFSSLIRKNREKLPPMQSPYTTEFVDQIRPFWKNAHVARFLGGEPFLNSLYFKMWDHIALDNPTIDVSITTNGTILNDRVKTIIQKIRPNISVSLDSLQKETYESIRINAKFDQVIQNVNEMIELLAQVDRKIHLSICPMTKNWHEMPEIFTWGTNRGISVNLNTVLNPEHLSLRFLPKTELKKIVGTLESKIQVVQDAQIEYAKPDNYTARSNAERYSSLINQIRAWSELAS